tara:strand:- start:2 stop:250 length:249 start_codon:yes stop_codon:yes gene_type:complete
MGWKKSLLQKKSISFLVLILFTEVLFGDDVLNSINSHKEKFSKVALEIWDYAELGYQENKSANLLAESLSCKKIIFRGQFFK